MRGRILGIIPARAGSKRFPNKNLAIVGGRPLIGWTVEQAMQSRLLDAIVLSTDSAEINEAARVYGRGTTTLRPAHLSGDDASIYDVIAYEVGRQELRYDAVMVLEPTSPLRSSEDIDRMCRLFFGSDAVDAVISYGPARTFSGRHAVDVPFPFGVGYLAATERLLSRRTFYLPNHLMYPIERWQCYEIDYREDAVCVEAIMKDRGWL